MRAMRIALRSWWLIFIGFFFDGEYNEENEPLVYQVAVGMIAGWRRVWKLVVRSWKGFESYGVRGVAETVPDHLPTRFWNFTYWYQYDIYCLYSLGDMNGAVVIYRRLPNDT